MVFKDNHCGLGKYLCTSLWHWSKIFENSFCISFENHCQFTDFLNLLDWFHQVFLNFQAPTSIRYFPFAIWYFPPQISLLEFLKFPKLLWPHKIQFLKQNISKLILCQCGFFSQKNLSAFWIFSSLLVYFTLIGMSYERKKNAHL